MHITQQQLSDLVGFNTEIFHIKENMRDRWDAGKYVKQYASQIEFWQNYIREVLEEIYDDNGFIDKVSGARM